MTMEVERVCSVQIDPMEFFGLLKWLDGRPLLDVMESYRQTIMREALSTFRPDGAPRNRRVLTGRAKKNFKTCDAVLAALYKCLVWKPAGSKLNEIYFVASDLGQANDDLQLCKSLIRRNGLLNEELTIRSNTVQRKDRRGFLEILPARNAQGLHGKTYLILVVDELHTQKDYRLLEARKLDETARMKRLTDGLARKNLTILRAIENGPFGASEFVSDEYRERLREQLLEQNEKAEFARWKALVFVGEKLQLLENVLDTHLGKYRLDVRVPGEDGWPQGGSEGR